MEQIPNNHLAERLLAARKMAGLSLQELAEKMKNSISRQAIHQFEQGKSKPESNTLLDLAKALNVRLDYFYRSSNLSFEKLEYRKKVKLSKSEEIAIQETAKDQLERYFEVEALTNAELTFENPMADFVIKNMQDIEIAAETVRNDWNLGLKPVPNVIQILEEKGIKVVEVSATDGFQGFSAEANGNLVVVLNAQDDVFRKRFTAVHELAHILLKFEDGIDIEKHCHAFAGAFLFPRESVITAFSAKRKKVSFAELLQQKSYYGISIQALLMRLKNLDIVNESTYKGFQIWLSKTGYRSKEQGSYAGKEQAMRFSTLLYRAAVEEVISLSKAANLNNQSLTEFRKTLIGE